VLSGAAGFAGMLSSVRGQRPHGPGRLREPRQGAELAFRSAPVTGMLVAGFALLGVAGYFYASSPALGLDRPAVSGRRLVALGFGASLISIFARLGGGIFTKGADVGGDMVGKVEAGIPGG
jgi:K(+)-stimulated pyrophosphate-energized sodium pump